MTLTGLPGYYGIFSLLTVLLIFSLRQKLKMSLKEVGALIALAAIIGIIIPFSLSIIGVWWTVTLASLSLLSVGAAVVVVRLREDRMVEGQLERVLKPVGSILPNQEEREPDPEEAISVDEISVDEISVEAITETSWQEAAVSLETHPPEQVDGAEADEPAAEIVAEEKELEIAEEISDSQEPIQSQQNHSEDQPAEPENEEVILEEPKNEEVILEQPENEEVVLQEPEESGDQALDELENEEPMLEQPENEEVILEQPENEEVVLEEPEESGDQALDELENEEPMLQQPENEEVVLQEPETEDPQTELIEVEEVIEKPEPPRVFSEQDLMHVQDLYLTAADWFRKQNYAAALGDLKQALAYDPPFAAKRMITNDYVRILNEMGLYQQSIGMLQKLLEQVPVHDRKIEMEIIHQIKYIENIIRLLQEQNRSNLPWSFVSPEMRKRAEDSLWTYIGSTIS